MRTRMLCSLIPGSSSDKGQSILRGLQNQLPEWQRNSGCKANGRDLLRKGKKKKKNQNKTHMQENWKHPC